MLDCLLVGAGGFVGTVCRYLIGLIPLKPQSGFPVKTFLINLLGSFVIGLIAALAAKSRMVDSRTALMLRVGVCGGFTTFSSFAYETAELFRGGSTGIALIYAAASVVTGVLMIFAAQLLVH